MANQPAHRSHRGDGTAVRGYRQQPLRDAGAVVSTNRPLRLTIIVRGRTLAFCRRAVRSRFSVRHMRRRTGGAFRASSPVTSFRLSPAKRYRRTHRTAGYFCLGSIARSTAAVIHRRAPYPLNGDGVSTYRHCRQSRSSTGLKFPQNRGHSPLRDSRADTSSRSCRARSANTKERMGDRQSLLRKTAFAKRQNEHPGRTANRRGETRLDGRFSRASERRDGNAFGFPATPQ